MNTYCRKVSLNQRFSMDACWMSHDRIAPEPQSKSVLFSKHNSGVYYTVLYIRELYIYNIYLDLKSKDLVKLIFVIGQAPVLRISPAGLGLLRLSLHLLLGAHRRRQ
jgi:hypothetical protein